MAFIRRGRRWGLSAVIIVVSSVVCLILSGGDDNGSAYGFVPAPHRRADLQQHYGSSAGGISTASGAMALAQWNPHAAFAEVQTDELTGMITFTERDIEPTNIMEGVNTDFDSALKQSVEMIRVGDYNQAWQIMTAWQSEAWDNFWYDFRDGNPQWETMGMIFGTLVVISNGATLLYLFTEWAFGADVDLQVKAEKKRDLERGPTARRGIIRRMNKKVEPEVPVDDLLTLPPQKEEKLV